jgi:hypothetical protein
MANFLIFYIELLTPMVEDICYNNAADYFGCES